MNYWFDKVYIGIVVENKIDGVYKQEDILCTVKDGVVFDLLNRKFYDLVEGRENQRSIPMGQPYVCGVYEKFPNEFPNVLLTRKGLIQVAEDLNNAWTYINIPSNQGIARTKGRRK